MIGCNEVQLAIDECKKDGEQALVFVILLFLRVSKVQQHRKLNAFKIDVKFRIEYI